MRKIDLTNKVFGEWTALKQSTTRGNRNQIQWDCVCSCGNIKSIKAEILKAGDSKSCGCLTSKMISENIKTHGLSKSRIYNTYRHMINRCYNKNVDMYYNYGGRGITVCDEWDNFESFHQWATCNGYQNNLTIDRKDNDKGYSPDNCKWSTQTEQQRNRRDNVLNMEKAIEVRRLRGIGERNIDIAKKFNISTSIASDVFHNKIWKQD